MTPIVMIPDEVFKRLQKHAQPSDDTPSSIIERLLDCFEETGSTERTGIETDNSQPVITIDESYDYENSHYISYQPNLFLVPAIKENIRVTIEKSVPVASIRNLMSPLQLETLNKDLNGKTDFYCWATTSAKISIFRTMHAGDYILITERGTGQFNWAGKVLTKFTSDKIGNYLWSSTTLTPWELIYVIDQPIRISIIKRELVSELGYSPNFVVMGTMRVQPSMVNRIISRYGSIDGFIQSHDQFAEERHRETE